MQNLITIPPQSTIGICAPSGVFDQTLLEASISIFKDRGYRTIIPDQISDRNRYLAGTDKDRAQTFINLFSDPDIDAVLCARGGYGSMRILKHIDFTFLKSIRKPVVGYSDATALLNTLILKSDAIVYHGPNFTDFSRAETKTIAAFFDTVSGNISSIDIDNAKVIIPGTCRARLIGGNLATLVHLIGTPYVPDFEDSLLFLEDINEPSYKVDRMLTQLELAGVFQKIKGIVLGSFHSCGSENELLEIFRETFEPYGVPVISGVQSGHGPVNLTIPLGLPVTLDTINKRLEWK